VNTAGTTLGALAASFVPIPFLEMRATLDLLVLLSAVALVIVGAGAGRIERPVGVALATVALLASRLVLPAWDARFMHLAVSKRPEAIVERYARGRLAEGLDDVHLLEMRDGVDATVSVAESGDGDRVLYVNGKPDASNGADMTNQALVGHLPVLVHPAPTRALVIGLGSGVTAASVARHPLESIDLIELSPEVLALGDRWFESINRGVVHDPRVHVRIEDGRNFVAFDDGPPYDVIVSEPSNPWMTGVSNLFTDELFAQLHRRLLPDGVLAQWCCARCSARCGATSAGSTCSRSSPRSSRAT
jgi:spermidine synthase